MTESWDKSEAGLQALFRDLRRRDERPAAGCERTRRHLDLFVGDELDGADVKTGYPAVWQHLQECADCRAEHDSLLEMLAVEVAGGAEAIPLQQETESWHVRLEQATAEARPALAFTFAPVYLRTSLRSTGQRSVNEERTVYDVEFNLRNGGATESLILTYAGEMPGGNVVVNASLRPDPEDAKICWLSLVAVGEPMPGKARVTWGEDTVEAPIGPEGEALLGPLPAGVLSLDAPDSGRFVLRLLL